MPEDRKGRMLSTRERIWVPDPEDGADIRFINPNPKLAQILAKREPIVLPAEAHEWIVEWIADIGTIMRSRSFMAYGIASFMSGTAMRFIPAPLGLR